MHHDKRANREETPTTALQRCHHHQQGREMNQLMGWVDPMTSQAGEATVWSLEKNFFATQQGFKAVAMEDFKAKSPLALCLCV
jgi:hypothetical protein